MESDLRNFWFENRYKYVCSKQRELTMQLAGQLKENFLYVNGTSSVKILTQIKKADRIRNYYIDKYRIETGLVKTAIEKY